MSVRVTRGPVDPTVVALRDRLAEYVASRLGSSAELYRRNPASVAVQVVDPGFAGTNRFDRHGTLWHYIAAGVPDDVLEQLGVLLTVTPAEAKTTIGSLEFDDPVAVFGPKGKAPFQVGPWPYLLHGDAVVASASAYDQQMNPPPAPSQP